MVGSINNIKSRCLSGLLVAMVFLGSCSQALDPAPEEPGLRFRTGYIPSTPVKSTLVRYASNSSGYSLKIPAAVDLWILQPYFGPVRDQGRQGSCLAFACAYAMNFTENRMAGVLDSSKLIQQAPAFLYNQIDHGIDAGSTYPDALALLENEGICDESLMPYNEKDFLSQPGTLAMIDASSARIEGYHPLDPEDFYGFRATIAGGDPVLIGLHAIPSFMAFRGKDRAFLASDIKEGTFSGEDGHAVILVGYDEDSFTILNSWGKKNWGVDGMAKISDEALRKLIFEAWVIENRRIEVGSTKLLDEGFGNPSAREAWVQSANHTTFENMQNWSVFGGKLCQNAIKTSYPLADSTGAWSDGYTSLMLAQPVTTPTIKASSKIAVSGQVRIGARDSWFQRAGTSSFGFNFSSGKSGGGQHCGSFWLQAPFSTTSDQLDAAAVMGIVLDEHRVSTSETSPAFPGFSRKMSQVDMEGAGEGSTLHYRFELFPLLGRIAGYIRFGETGSEIEVASWSDKGLMDMVGGNLLVQPVVGTANTECSFDDIIVEFAP